MSAADETTMDYEINNAKTVRILKAEHGVNIRLVPQPIVEGLAVAANEMVEELLADPDPVVREVMGSYAKFRNLMAEYAPYAFAGEMNARTLPFAEG
jgi:TRAP-type mannitol/chloroaromatic compound transport system substrate-binding protein